MLTTATALSSWAKVIKRTLDLAGHDGAALVREAGLDPRLLDDPNARYPVSQTGQLWKVALRETRDPCFGFKVASQVTQGTFHALSYSIASSSTLKDAFERMERYARIFSDAGELKFRSHGDEYHFVFTPKAALPDESVDAFVSVYVRMCRALSGDRSLSPRRIDLCRPTPADRRCFDTVLRAPLTFGASRNLLVYVRADLERPLEGGNPELASHHDEIARKYLARFSKDNLMARVESVLLDRLPHGEPSQDDIAQALHLSARTLQRKLADQGKSYKEILDTTRHDLAVSYLKDREYSISEVTYLLGFSDTSSFTRAFKRWTGKSPSAFREGDFPMAPRVTKA